MPVVEKPAVVVTEFFHKALEVLPFEGPEDVLVLVPWPAWRCLFLMSWNRRNRVYARAVAMKDGDLLQPVMVEPRTMVMPWDGLRKRTTESTLETQACGSFPLLLVINETKIISMPFQKDEEAFLRSLIPIHLGETKDATRFETPSQATDNAVEFLWSGLQHLPQGARPLILDWSFPKKGAPGKLRFQCCRTKEILLDGTLQVGASMRKVGMFPTSGAPSRRKGRPEPILNAPGSTCKICGDAFHSALQALHRMDGGSGTGTTPPPGTTRLRLCVSDKPWVLVTSRAPQDLPGSFAALTLGRLTPEERALVEPRTANSSSGSGPIRVLREA